MRSLLDDIVTTITNGTFTIPNIQVRTSYSDEPKSYPLVVVFEMDNIPENFATVSGEDRTRLPYQIDIHTQTCTDTDDNIVSAFDAGRILVSEINDLLDSQYKFTRRTVRPPQSPATDVVVHILRGECTLDSYGYSYRP